MNKVQHPVLQEVQGFIQMQAGPTGCEAGCWGWVIVFKFVFEVDLNPVFCQYTHVADVILIALMEVAGGHRIIKLSHLGLVRFLSKFSPHGVQHHLGQGSQTRIFSDVGRVETNFVLGIIVLHVQTLFLGIVTHVGRPTAGFFDLWPHVYVIGEEPLLLFWKVPHLMDV